MYIVTLLLTVLDIAYIQMLTTSCILTSCLPVGSKALSFHELNEKHKKDHALDEKTVSEWRQHWQERKENGLFSKHVLEKISKAEKISFQAGKRTRANLELALDKIYQSNNI
jgi:hypothetical protein